MLELMSDPYVVLVPAENALAPAHRLEWTTSATRPLIGSKRGASGVVVERELGEHGYDIRYAFRSDDNGTVQGLVASGFGVALTPLLAIAPGDDRVKILRLVPKVPRRQVAVVWHRDRHRSPAARAFIEIARDVSADIERDLVEP